MAGMKKNVHIIVLLLAALWALPVAAQGRRQVEAKAQVEAQRFDPKRFRTESRRTGPSQSQYSGRDVSHYDFILEPNGDTTTLVYVNRVYCFSKPVDMSKHWRTVRDFRRVYPLALIAHTKMAAFEEQLMALPSRRLQREFARATEKSLVGEYTPVLKKMTINQGKILIKLIDRETNMTSYDIVREFRGGFVAGFWQGIARIFGHNLKDEYDPVERDRVIEQCILLYNAGLLPEY